MWSNLLSKAKNQSIFDVYNNTSSALNKLRDQRIVNGLNQIKLNYAPQMAQQGADLGAANVSIKQNEAKYASQMSLADLAQKHSALLTANLQREGMSYENIIRKAEASGAPEKVLNGLKLQRAQIAVAFAKANALSNGGSKNAPTFYDPKTGAQMPNPSQQMGGQQNPSAPMPFPNSAPPQQPQMQPGGSPPDNAPAPFNPMGNMGGQSPPSAPDAPPADIGAPQQMQQPIAQQPLDPGLPGADPKAPNVLQSVGPSDSRGHAAALYNPHTGERFSVLSPTQRTQMQNQLISLRQAVPYIDDLKKYGTIGKFGASGANELLPNGAWGVSRGEGAEYDKALAAATEHVMTGSKLQKTDATVGMVHTILARQNFESRADYTNRMNKFQQHLRDLDENTKNNLSINAMSLDKYTSDAEQKYVTDQYNKAISKTVRLVDKDGNEFDVPVARADEAIKDYHLKRKE